MNFFRWRQRKDEDLNTEIQQHLDEAIRERMERDESAEQAQGNAQREFGNVGLVKVTTRKMWDGGLRLFSMRLQRIATETRLC